MDNYINQSKEIEKNILYLTQFAKNLSMDQAWMMTWEQRETLVEVLKEIKEAEKKSFSR